MMKSIRENYFTDGELDFNKIVPRPESLNLTDGSITINAITYAISQMSQDEQSDIDTMLKESGNRSIRGFGDLDWANDTAKRYEPNEAEAKLGIKTFADLGNAYLNNIKEHGHATWCGWSIDNWGTKWNSSEFQCDDSRMAFLTAWSTPDEIFIALSNLYPDEQFYVEYANEDIGNNCGWVCFENGLEVNCSIEGDDFACDVWNTHLDNSIDESTSLESESIDAISASNELDSVEPSKSSNISR